MNPTLKIILFVVTLVALLVFQAKGVMPVVRDIATSALFLEESADQASQISTSNDMTNHAFNHCNTYISDDIDSDFSVTFSKKPINAWSLGNYQYIINAEIEVTPTDAESLIKRYACRISYTEKDDLSIAGDVDNWSIDGISGMNDL